uniref:diphosphoinositol-pentakisphosphate 1-kinase n=1 Tax=Brassica oleracea TaxID=3712 RepID=A0A3P6B392_BRAOL|nr:unnamed protein product [Brassica oleracea]
MCLDAKALHLLSTLPPTLPWKFNKPVQPNKGLTRQGNGHSEELRCVIAVIRHGDRTPKQKVNLNVTEEKLLNLMLKYNGGKPRAEPLKWDGEGEEERHVEALMILKYDGVLTHAGRKQSEELGRFFLYNMYPGEGTGLFRLHSTYRHDLKIYSSDEGRVQVSLVSKDSSMLDGLDTASIEMEAAKIAVVKCRYEVSMRPAYPSSKKVKDYDKLEAEVKKNRRMISLTETLL